MGGTVSKPTPTVIRRRRVPRSSEEGHADRRSAGLRGERAGAQPGGEAPSTLPERQTRQPLTDADEASCRSSAHEPPPLRRQLQREPSNSRPGNTRPGAHRRRRRGVLRQGGTIHVPVSVRVTDSGSWQIRCRHTGDCLRPGCGRILQTLPRGRARGAACCSLSRECPRQKSLQLTFVVPAAAGDGRPSG